MRVSIPPLSQKETTIKVDGELGEGSKIIYATMPGKPQ